MVAVQPNGDHLMRVYSRHSDTIQFVDHPFFPFFFVSDIAYLQRFSAKHWIKKLDGDNFFQYLCAFETWSEMWDAVRLMFEQYNTRAETKAESYAGLPFLHLRTDAVSQFLLQTGRTLFKGMEFSEIHRMQLDIETYSSHNAKFSNAERPDDQIIIVALSDNRGWEHVVSCQRQNEKSLLQELVQIIREKDPDVIEGHNIYNFDLPYILTRCKLHGVDFSVGRDGSSPRAFDSRMSFADRSVGYSAHEIPGRHIIDTWLLVQAYDLSKRSLESYGLKYAARYFGFAKEDRIYIQPEKISWYWDHEPDLLIRYALDDVRETRHLSEHLSQSSFYLTQMLPLNYGAVARLGSSAKIESLILREYVSKKYSIPKPEPGMQTTGGYTDIFYTGVLGPIIDVDIESLYPSIMIREKINPAREPLGVFSVVLEELTRLRLDTKRKMQSATDPSDKSKLDAMQSSYKILINSFYGYLGYNRALFNDMKAADQITKTGQLILRQLISAIIDNGGTVVEVDTDGIFFVPPPNVRSETEEQSFVQLIARDLPLGIHLALAGRFKRMLSYKKKNYVLLEYDNKVKVKGSSLSSRSTEKFGRNFLQQCFHCLLNNDIQSLHTLYTSLYQDIEQHALSIYDFARTETLKEVREEYLSAVQEGKRNRTASYEVALGSGIEWKPGERISYYITGNDPNIKGFENCRLIDEWNPEAPNENVSYYLRRLDELVEKFQVFFSPQDFRSIFSLEDLFGFSAEKIILLTLPVEQKYGDSEEDENEQIPPGPKIMLDDGE